jgi:PAS domain-containing protein
MANASSIDPQADGWSERAASVVGSVRAVDLLDALPWPALLVSTSAGWIVHANEPARRSWHGPIVACTPLRDVGLVADEVLGKRQQSQVLWRTPTGNRALDLRRVPASPDGSMVLLVQSEPAKPEPQDDDRTRHTERLQAIIELGQIVPWNLELDPEDAPWPADPSAAALRDPSYGALLEHIVPEDRGRLHAAFRSAIQGDATAAVECRYLLDDGSTRWLWLAARRYQSSIDGKDYVLGVSRDVTPLKSVP